MLWYAGVAQSVEQLTCNQQVVGSIPIASSIIFGGIPERPKGADCKSAVIDFEGSNPSPTTITRFHYQTFGFSPIRRKNCCCSLNKSANVNN